MRGASAPATEHQGEDVGTLIVGRGDEGRDGTLNLRQCVVLYPINGAALGLFLGDEVGLG